MARINTYSKDTTIQKDDKLLGSNADGTTRNFSIEDIGTFQANTNSAAIAGQLSYVYHNNSFGGNSTQQSGSVHISTADLTTSFSSVTALRVHKNPYGNNTGADQFIQILEHKKIIISRNDDPNSFGILEVDTVTVDYGNPDFFDLALSYVSGPGSFVNDEFYSISIYSINGENNTTYDLSVPSLTTTIRLAGSDNTNDDVTISGSGTTTVTRTSSSELTISSADQYSGTVTSVSGAGTVSGLTLSGTVTSSGSLTLGGSLTLTSSQITTGLGYTPYNSTNPDGYTTNTGTVTSVTLAEGALIDLSGTNPITTSGTITIGVDLNELTTSTSDADGDFFAVIDTLGAQKKLTKANINLSGFNNDSGFVTSSGVTGTGTTNYLAKFTSSSVVGDSSIFDNGTNVGIGTASPSQDLHVDGNARVTGAIYDSNNEPGTSGQVLSSTATGTDWVDQGTIAASSSEKTVVYVKNTHTASISKGTPVYITGTVGATDTVEIAPADASNSAKMPAVGILDDTLAVNDFGYVITGGFMGNITTDPIDGVTPSSNDTVYVKSGGGLTLTKPTGSNLIQNIAKVGKVSGGSSGTLIVSSILRTNDVPNLTAGRVFVGTSSNTAESAVVYLDESNSRLGVGTSSPSQDLHVAGNARITGAVYDSNNNAGSSGQVLSSTVTGTDWIDVTLTPAGSNEQIQFNDNGSFGASSTFVFDGTHLGIGTSNPTAELHIVSSGIDDTVLISNSNTSSDASPVLTMRRDSASPADGDYLGQLKFQGENDIGQQVFYAKYTAKIGDVTDGTEDGLLETMVRANGSNLIVQRQTSTDLKLINGIGLEVDGSAGIGTTSASAKLHVVGDGATSSTSSLLVQNSATTELFRVRDDGSVYALGSGAVATNTAFGKEAFKSNATGSDNIALGFEALTNNTASANTAVGSQALKANTSGGDNTGLGYSALISNSTGSSNVAVGRAALNTNTSGNFNIAIGKNSLLTNSTGSNNVAIGDAALQDSTASGNTATGKQSAFETTTGSNNTAAGYQSFYYNTTGANNVAMGYRALMGNGVTTNWSNAVGIGYSAGQNNTANNLVAIGYQSGFNNTGASNSFIGYAAGKSNTSGTVKVAIGSNADQNNTTGGYSVFIGGEAGQGSSGSTTASSNVGIGYRSLFRYTTGGSNVAIGHSAMFDLTTGSTNVAVGSSAAYNLTTASDNVAIGATAMYTQQTGIRNVAIGKDALRTADGGLGNIAVGVNAWRSATTGSYNVGMGDYVGYYMTTGSGNVGIGYRTNFTNTAGNYNVAVGYSALNTASTGSYNVALGYAADSGGFSESVMLGRSATATASNQFVVGSSSYNVGAVTTETITADKTWTVKINGTDYKIPIVAA